MVPIGGIIIWSGAIGDIPENFALCDGQNATPDLKDRFIVGAGDAFTVDEIGGETQHTHAAGSTIDGAGAGPVQLWSGFDNSAIAGTLPPYYGLAYIMRIT